MKRIKHIKEIEQEKMRLRIRQLELERSMQQKWSDTKDNLLNAVQWKEKLAASMNGGDSHNSLVAGLVKMGAGYAGRVMGEKVQDLIQGKIEQWIDSFQEGHSRKERSKRKNR
ncbi:MAG TPA: hypothetical protein PKC72_09325 [Chitinophagaceae bacterium]|nr:hypothetical protein [Chitinophagaceae bacterium]